MESFNEKTDYLILVNKQNPVPDDWPQRIRTVHCTNSLGLDVETETAAYEAYLNLKEELQKDGIFVDLDSALRSRTTQEQIAADFTREYGEEYTAKIVAVPGYSEHHTGLALDLYLNVNGEDVYFNFEMMEYAPIWEKIHQRITDHGFILRYPQEREHITGYVYEPWHIRYVGKQTARIIHDQNLTLEEYLKGEREYVPHIDYGHSSLYTQEELREMAILIKCRFAAWRNCHLRSLAYAGDCEEVVFTMKYVADPDRDEKEGRWFLRKTSGGDWVIDRYLPSE